MASQSVPLQAAQHPAPIARRSSRRGGAPEPAAAADARGRRRRCGSPAAAAATKAAPAPTTGNNNNASNTAAVPPAVYLDDAPTRALVAWARDVAKIAGFGSKVKPATFAGLRGLAATSAAEEGDLLLSVPRASAITLPPKRRCPEGVPSGWWERAPWYARLAALLLLEKRRVAAAAAAAAGGGGGGGDAKSARPLMAPYLATLPQSFREMPYYWTDAQLDALRYPALQQAVREQRREWRQLHDSWAAEAATQQAPPAPPTLAELEWALSAVRSRTFSGPYVASTLASRGRLATLVAALAAASALLGGADADSLGRAVGGAVAALVFNVLYETTLSGKLRQYVLCPAIDLLNHSSREGAEATYDYFRDSFSVSAGAGGFVAPGRQVYGSYGAQSNDSLAQYYGFVERDNPHDVYVITRALDWVGEVVLGAGGGGGTGGTGGGGGGGGNSGSALAAAAARAGVTAELSAVRVVSGSGLSAETVGAMRRLLAEAVDGRVDAGAGAEAVLAAVLRRELQELLEGGAPPPAGGGGGEGRKAGAGSSSSSSSSAAAARLAADFRAEKRKVLDACLARMVAAADGG
jgi:hypothetical protein